MCRDAPTVDGTAMKLAGYLSITRWWKPRPTSWMKEAARHECSSSRRPSSASRKTRSIPRCFSLGPTSGCRGRPETEDEPGRGGCWEGRPCRTSCRAASRTRGFTLPRGTAERGRSSDGAQTMQSVSPAANVTPSGE